jgi:predicted transcriptional regulator
MTSSYAAINNISSNFVLKSMKYRSRFEIMSQILETANGGDGATKTKIMYKAFLSFLQLKEFLKFLTESGLISYDTETETFKTTEKGLMFLRTYSQINEMMKVSEF